MNIIESFQSISNGTENYSIPCIYKITNTENGNFYIGQTKSFYQRLRDHYFKMMDQQITMMKILQNKYYSTNDFKSLRSSKICYLRRGEKEEKNKLQLEYRNFPPHKFTMEIIEKCPEKDLLERERFWIKYLDAEKSLNGNTLHWKIKIKQNISCNLN